MNHLQIEISCRNNIQWSMNSFWEIPQKRDQLEFCWHFHGKKCVCLWIWQMHFAHSEALSLINMKLMEVIFYEFTVVHCVSKSGLQQKYSARAAFVVSPKMCRKRRNLSCSLRILPLLSLVAMKCFFICVAHWRTCKTCMASLIKKYCAVFFFNGSKWYHRCSLFQIFKLMTKITTQIYILPFSMHL